MVRMDAEALLEGLDDAQRRAASSITGPVRIIAGAGAGKTRTITHRIAYGIATREWNASQVLAVTFSVKAATEMRQRLNSLHVPAGVRAATFHSAALHQLREVWSDICNAPLPYISEDQDANARRAVMRITGIREPDIALVRDARAEINWCKVSLIAPSDYPRVCAATHRIPPCGLSTEQFVNLYETYEQEKTGRGEIDFNDILLLTAHVIDTFPVAARTIRSSIGWLTVDEYQDVSPLQHHLLTRWLGDNTNICVVGDPAQTIYSFAGATSYYLTQFGNEFAPLRADIALDRDYRSVPSVITTANRILSRSSERGDYLKLHAVQEGGKRVTRLQYPTDEQEARGVAHAIREIIDSGDNAANCAILTRINAQQDVFARALRNEGIPYRLKRDISWQRSALADELHQLDEPQSEHDGRVHVTADNAAVQTRKLDELGVSHDGGSVLISTIHASKGLEFPHVFVVGCSEGLLPFGTSQDAAHLEEERRLMYVGVTRAEQTLQISYAQRKDNETSMMRHPSRFLM